MPQHDDRILFEFLVLEGAQAGLSWETILRKRDNYRRAFDHFDPELVAHYDAGKVEELLADPGIVRNRLKIMAAIGNARAFLAIQEEFGSFDALRLAICERPTDKEYAAIWRSAYAHNRIGRHEQRPDASGIQVRGNNDLLCLHASCRDGQ